MRISVHTSPAQQAWGITVLRVIVGVVFLVHGFQKAFVTGMTGVAAFMGEARKARKEGHRRRWTSGNATKVTRG